LSLTLREEYRFRAFENRVLRSIFGLKTREVTGGGKKIIRGTLSFLLLAKYYQDQGR
jgi:hypothetical protein